MKKIGLLFLLFSAFLSVIFMYGCNKESGLKKEGLTSPTDIYRPQGNTPPQNTEDKDQDSSEDNKLPASPDDPLPSEPNVPDTPALMSFSYTAYHNVSSDKLQSAKEWMDSLGGLPGFSATATFNLSQNNYEIAGEMGGSEAIDYMEITESYVKVVFRKDILLHDWMHSCIGGVMMNSSKQEVQGGDGKMYMSTVYKYSANGGTVVDPSNGSPAYMTVTFDAPITEPITDLYIYWGSID